MKISTYPWYFSDFILIVPFDIKISPMLYFFMINTFYNLLVSLKVWFIVEKEEKIAFLFHHSTSGFSWPNLKHSCVWVYIKSPCTFLPFVIYTSFLSGLFLVIYSGGGRNSIISILWFLLYFIFFFLTRDKSVA